MEADSEVWEPESLRNALKRPRSPGPWRVGSFVFLLAPFLCLALSAVASPQPTAETPRSKVDSTLLDSLPAFLEEFLFAIHDDLDRARSLSESLAHASESTKDEEGSALAQICRAWTTIYSEGPVSAEPLVLAALDSLPPEAPVASFALGLMRANFSSTNGEHAASLRAVQDARESLAPEPGHLFYFRALLTEYWILRSIGATPALKRCLDELRTLRARFDYGFLGPWVDLAEHDALWHDGQIVASEVALRRSLGGAEKFGDRYLEAECHYNLGWLRWEEGETDHALDHLRITNELMSEVGDRNAQGAALDLQACILRDGERAPEALDRIEEGLKIVEGRGFTEVEHELYATGSEIAATLNDSEALLRFSRNWADLRDHLYGEENWRALVSVREELARSEVERNAERERAREAERRRATQLAVAAVAVTTLLSLLCTLLLWGRKRLSLSHERLQREMETAREAESARQTLEERMRQLDRLQGLGLIAGGVAHDFNNLLVGVLGNADLLLQSKDLSGSNAGMVREISHSAQRAAGLCRQLLVYAGKAPLEAGPVELHQLSGEAIPVLRSAVSHEVSIEISSSGSPVWISGDSTQIEQVLLNLITNSRDAGASKVRIRISKTRLTDQELAQRGLKTEGEAREFAVLEIEDDGEGIDPKTLSHIFDPFFTTRFPGRGLGLAAVFGIVRRHHGMIEAMTGNPRGTCFRVTIPATNPKPQPPAKLDPGKSDAASLPSLAGRQVLVVEDEESVRDLTCRMLANLGLSAVAVGNCASALSETDRVPGRFSFVLLDLTLSDGDGGKSLSALRTRLPDCPILVMSGHSRWEILERCGDPPPDWILQKPFTQGTLSQALTSVRKRSDRSSDPVEIEPQEPSTKSH